MDIQKTIHKTKHAASLELPGLALADIVVVVMFVFPAALWSQTAEWTVYNTANSGLPYNGITGLAVDARDNIWVGTGKWYAFEGGGLAKFDGENWTVYNTTNSGLPHNDHTGLAIDPRGNIWSGTEGGLAKFDTTSWTVYTTGNSGLRNNLVSTPSFDAQGNMWIGSWGGGLAHFDGQNWKVYTTGNSGLPNNRAWATASDVQGKLWVGTMGGGLAQFNGENWTVYNRANSGLPHNDVTSYSLPFDAQGNLWIGTDGGLARFGAQTLTVYNTGNSGLPSNRIWALDIDAQNNIWIGTYGGGLARFDGVNWTVYNTSNSGLPDNRVYCLAIDAQGNVWIGTESGGLAVYRIGERLPIVDFNGDGFVDIKDLLRLIQSWGQNDPMVDIAPPSGDGVIDFLDLELLMSYWDQSVDDPTLMAHWALDEAEGDVAYDSAGVNDAILIGEPVWQPESGKVGGALTFDGADDCAFAQRGLNPAGGPFSVFAWAQGGAPGQVVISQLDGANWLGMDPSCGFLMTDLCASGRGGGPLKSKITITDGVWHRVGFVWDGAYRALYIDDILVAEDIQHGLGSSIGGLNIGCGMNSTVGTFWSGLIDEVRIYSRAVRP